MVNSPRPVDRSEISNPSSSKDARLNTVLEENIQKLLEQRKANAQRRSYQQRIADAITAFAGSMAFVYLHIAIVGLWVLINVGLTPLPKFDPTFVILATVASVEAIFLSTFILISQNRMTTEANARADLDLQISLLAEHEITRLIHLVVAIAERMDLQEAKDPRLEELKRDVSPEVVVDKIQEINIQSTQSP